MKQRRRTLKNRGYAASCRNKRFKRKGELESQKRHENQSIEQLMAKINRYREIIAQLHAKIADCLFVARQHNIDLNEDYCDGSSSKKTLDGHHC